MSLIRRTVLGALATLPLVGFAPQAAQAADEIVIGEVNSYTRLPAFTEPYKKGWQLAVEQINAAGGIDGKQLKVISRDDTGDPATAIRIAEELVSKEGAALIFGTFLSNIGLAVADFAKQKEVLFLASEPLSDAIVWSKGNKYTYRLRPSTHMQAAMLAEQAAKLDAVKWATIAPNYAYGQDAVKAFKSELSRLRPDVEFVTEQWPPVFKIDAGSTVRALEASKPDAIFNVTFGGDLAKFVREGSLRFLFEDRAVASLLTGEPEYLQPLGNETPEGWIVTGYPGTDITTDSHAAFAKAYIDMFGEEPKTGSIVGYNSILSIAAALTKAGSTDTAALLAAMEGLEVADSPTGPFMFRAADHQSTMGAYVGKTSLVDGQPKLVDWNYADGSSYLPSEEEAAKLRPAD
ncbi:twin-arginine translocation pathway signal protein [Phaeobacter gallaeciensis]|uniref:Twin-arginine translocation pathway signal protein n=2 Tax=Roseobacteraceae TaxID=2854170 RepID=A0A366X7V7_9RHOB|nr:MULTISPECIES: ABC transporter substrate-binding protein [Roseobacteraceae]MBT3142573.1 ABC transporter substrate-binding protein [Falsiruegeria litorea]MBT8170977.1 ABC transporter substrate-binding protein [Falsiruegeria litorea]RBW58384.1 twin-arginine translocation pathway signal protein [Phaeobacter gallaeciensis]